MGEVNVGAVSYSTLIFCFLPVCKYHKLRFFSPDTIVRIKNSHSRSMSCTFPAKNGILITKGGPNMNQPKIGSFLRALRNEKGLTQEQLAEVLGVSNRSISRWENGANLPDLDLLIQIAKYYDVGIEEILNGERTVEVMDKKTEETLLKVADYTNNEKMVFSKRLSYFFLAGLAAFIVYMILDVKGLTAIQVYEDIASYMLGLVGGVLVVGALYTSRYMAKIRAFKLRLLKRDR